MSKLLIIGLFFAFIGSSVFAQFESQWRGPNRDGKYPNEKLLEKWPAQGPKLLWKAKGLGDGFSSPAVTKNRVYVTAMIDGEGLVFVFDLNGKQLAKYSYGPEWDGGHKGVRTTPTIVGDKIYLFTGYARLVCMSTSGKIIWDVDTQKEFGTRQLNWGITESVVVDGDRVFCTPGGSDVMVVVLDRNTGKTIKKIKGTGEQTGYCSPVIVKHGNRRLLLTMTGKSVVGIDADSYEFLWSAPHKTQYDINPNTPLYLDGKVLTTSGYGTTGTQLFQISSDGKAISKVWQNGDPDSQIAASVIVDGFVYLSGQKNRGWYCLDWTTGETKWKSRELYGKGPIIYADGKIFIYSDKGDVGLVKPNSEKFDLSSSFVMTEGSGEHWAHPVINNGRFYLRHGDVMHVYDIAAN
jgi:outer membrane protein assembly factor BamB